MKNQNKTHGKNSRKTTCIIFASIIACIAHAVILNVEVNEYLFTSLSKLLVFVLTPIACYYAMGKRPHELLMLIYRKTKPKGISGYSDKQAVHRKAGVKLSCKLAAAVFAFLAVVFIILRPFLVRDDIVNGLAGNNITGENFPFVFAYVILCNAALEEFFFRGFIFLTLYKLGQKRTAYVYSCLLFAVYHIFIMDSWFHPAVFALLLVGLAVSGVIFNELARRTDSIIGSLIVHMSANLAINLVGVYYLYFA